MWNPNRPKTLKIVKLNRPLSWKTKTKTSTMTKIRRNKNLKPSSRKNLMDPKSRSTSETIKKLSSKKVKTETLLSTYPQAWVKRGLPLPPCTITCPLHKRKRLYSWPILFSWSSNKLRQLRGLFMEFSKTKDYAEKSTKSMQEIRFISIGLGTEFAGKLSAFMVKRMKNLAKQRKKKFRVHSCQKNSSWGNFKTQPSSLSSHKCSSIVFEEDSLSWQTSHLSSLMNAIIVKATIRTLESWMNFTLTWRKRLKKVPKGSIRIKLCQK